jgi:hypothetical protein
MTHHHERYQKTLDSRLIHAVRRDRRYDVIKLLDEGANPSATEVRTRQVFGFGRVPGACDSALITAARKGTPESHEIIRILVAAGADPTYRNHWGETAGGLIANQVQQLRREGIESILLAVLASTLVAGTRSNAG